MRCVKTLSGKMIRALSGIAACSIHSIRTASIQQIGFSAALLSLVSVPSYQVLAAEEGGEGDEDSDGCDSCGGEADSFDTGENDVCDADSECDECQADDEPSSQEDAGPGEKKNHPVNWETGEKWETMSDLRVALSGKDFRLTRHYSSDPSYTLAPNYYNSRYPGSRGTGSGGWSIISGGLPSNPTVGSHWSFSNLRAAGVHNVNDCVATDPCPPTGEPPTSQPNSKSEYFRTDFALFRPGRKPRTFQGTTFKGPSSNVNKPGNQGFGIDLSAGGYNSGDSIGNCDNCGGVDDLYDGMISGTAVFGEPGRWQQKYKIIDGFGYLKEHIDEFGNRQVYEYNTTSHLPEYIHLNGSGTSGGSLTWTDPDRVEAMVKLFWEEITTDVGGQVRTLDVLVRAEVRRPSPDAPTAGILTQYVEYYHLADDDNDGLEVNYHNGTSYSPLINPSTASALVASDDLGTEGDLVQVVRYKLVNDQATTPVFRPKVTQYRYHNGETVADADDIRLETDGLIHQLKMSFAPQQLEHLAQHMSTSTSPTEQTAVDQAYRMLAWDDGDTITKDNNSTAANFGEPSAPVSAAVYEAAEKILSYTKLGDSPVDHQFLQSASCGCGSSGAQSAVLYTYDQFEWTLTAPFGQGNDIDGTSIHIKEHALSIFSSLPTGTPYRTTCYDLLKLGDNGDFTYRWAFVELEGDGTGPNDRAWVNRTNYDIDDRIVTGKITPSGFTGYTKAAANTPPTFTLAAVGEGLEMKFDHANENIGGTRYGPRNGPYELKSKATYYTDTDPDLEAIREFLPVKQEYYRVAGSTAAENVETVDYEYGFETDSSKRDWTRTIEEREVIDENGPALVDSPNPNTVEHWEFYDNKGRVIWTVGPEGVLTRYEYDPQTGRLVKRVENSQSPDELTAPTDIEDSLYATYHDLVEPGAVHGLTSPYPDPFPSSTGSDGELVTEYKRDLLGRLTQTIYPGDVTRTIVREMLEDSTRPGIEYFAKTYFPHLASDPLANPKVFSGPATTRIMDVAGNTLRSSGHELSITGTYAPEDIVSTSAFLGDEISRSTRKMDLSGAAVESKRWWDVSSDYSYTTTSEYDSFGRLTKVTDPSSSVTEREYDVQDRVVEVSVGTTTNTPEAVVEYIYDGDSGDTTGPVDPGVGNGNLTGVVLHDGAGNTRVSRIYYDHRDRQIGVVLPDAPMSVSHHDNLDRVIQQAVYPDPDTDIPSMSDMRTVTSGGLPNTDASSGTTDPPVVSWLFDVYRASYSKTKYSQRGYIWREETAIDPSQSSPEFLEWNAWYDDDGNEIASWGPNSPKIVYEYDAHDRVTKLMISDRKGDGTAALTFTEFTGVANDNVLDQAEYTYESGTGLLEMVTSLMRVHDDSTTGSLTGTNSITTYMSYVYDNAQRVVGMVDYGTNKSTTNPFSKSAGTVPTLSDYATLSDIRDATDVLFGWRTYNSRGMIEDLISIQDGTSVSDQIHARYLYDDMYRTIGTVENADAVTSLTWDSTNLRYSVSGFDHTKQDTDRVTSYVYNGSGNMIKRVAHLPVEDSGVTIQKIQETQYVYGVASGSASNVMDSLIESNNLLFEVRYPNESTGEASSDPEYKVQYAYNRLGELRGVTDQNGTVRSFGRDEQGRMKYDKVDMLGTFTIDGSSRTVDGTVKRLGYDYDTLGRMSSIASFTDTAGTTPSAVRDEVKMTYTPLWQIESVTQQHDGVVDADSAQVLYVYDNMDKNGGEENYSRLTEIVYPTDNATGGSGHTVQYEYATGVDDQLSRINGINVHGFNQLGSGSLAFQDLISYERIGMGMMAKAEMTINTGTPTSLMDYITLDRTVQHDGNSPAGTYPALDRFGRVTSHMWVPEGFSTGTGGYSNFPAIVETTHTYDRSSNRLTYHDAREGARLPGRNRDFGYDRLNRVVEESRATLPAASGFVPQHSGHQWDLDMLGNWDFVTNDGNNNGDFTDDASYADNRGANFANEIEDTAVAQYDRKLGGGAFSPSYYDYHYDDSGNLTDERTDNQLPLTYTPFKDGRQHSYDAWNRLVKSEMRTTGGTVLKTIGEYTYNALGWRTSKKADTSTGSYDGVIDQERTFYYGASWRILEEHVDSDLSSTEDEVWISQEFWGARYIDDSLAKRVDRGGTGDWSIGNDDLSHWYRVTDSQFSVVGVLNDVGVMFDRVSYDAYGNARHRHSADANGDGSVTNSDFALPTFNATIGSGGYFADMDANFDGKYDGVDGGLIYEYVPISVYVTPLPDGWISDPNDLDGPDNSIGYAGYVLNAEREDYSVRFRVYSPELGRWMQRDPIGYWGGGNLYQYTLSSPANFTDPLGLCTDAQQKRACLIKKAADRNCNGIATISEELAAMAAGAFLAAKSAASAGVSAGSSSAARDMNSLAKVVQSAGNPDGAALIRSSASKADAFVTGAKVVGNLASVGALAIDGYYLYHAIDEGDTGGIISSSSGIGLTALTVAGGFASSGTPLALAGPWGVGAAAFGAAVLIGHDFAVGRPARNAAAASKQAGCNLVLGQLGKYLANNPGCSVSEECCK